MGNFKRGKILLTIYPRGVYHQFMRVTNPNKRIVLKRLNIIRGQLEGLANMINEDVYCVDVFNQSLAIQNSLKSLDSVILEGHLKTHAADQFKKNDKKAVTELVTLFKRSNK